MSGDAESAPAAKPATEDRSALPRRSFWAELLLPPDFYPERQLDARTWAEAIFEPVALIGAVVCFVLGIVSFGLAIAPNWQPRFLIVLSVVVGVEAFLYSRRLTRSAVLFKEWLALLVPPIALVRFLPYLDEPSASLVGDLGRWWRDPGTFFTAGFLADLAVLLVVWSVVFSCTRCLNQLRVQEGEIPTATDARFGDLYEDNWRSYDHSEPLRRLGQVYLWGGVILVLLAALASIGTSQFLSLAALGQLVGFQRPSLHLALANVFLYFVLGLLLLGEAQFVRQRTIWRLDRLAVPEELIGRWVTAVIGLVGVASLIAIILPTSYAMTLGQIVSFVVLLVVELFAYLAAAVFYLLYLVSLLFPHSSGSVARPAPALPPPVLHPGPSPASASPLETIRSLVFWLVALGILLYSLSVLWRRRGASLGRVPFGHLLTTPLRLLARLWGLIRRAGRQVGKAIASAVPGLFRPFPVSPRRTFRFLSLARLGPRELIEYFYLSVCERAGQLGHPRPPAATPIEYREMLRAALPLVDPELDALTDAFIEARYGPRPTTQGHVAAARRIWQALKVKLRKARLKRSS